MINLNLLKRQLSKLAISSTPRMGDIIIFTTIAGWIASSAAQIYGIAVNKKYSREQKKYMINQEAFDALTNIGLYFGITKSLTLLSSTLVKTAKIAPKTVIKFLEQTGTMPNRGRLGFDVTQVSGFSTTANVRNAYNGFKCFADASAATVGGIISSNIITPIVRNHIAAYRQNKFKAQNKMAALNEQGCAKNSASPKPAISTTPHSFNDYRNHVLGI